MAKKSVLRGKDVKFSEVDLDTPYVKEFIKKEAPNKGKSEKEYREYLQTKLTDRMSKMPANLRISGQDRKNAIEGILFDEMTVDPTDKTVTMEELKLMFKWIRANNRAFFSLRDPITGKIVKLSIHMTPMPPFVKQPEYMKNVKTAAATATGEIIFNLDFCRKLIKYTEVKDVKANGKMYVSNGGKIPDSYAYIEFLILHEIYHIVHADHFYQSKTEGMTPKLQNYLGDYITNYELVKKGYAQIPIGLFSDAYNYDNFTTMHDMQKQIIADFKELNKEQEQQMDDQMDDHLDSENQQTNKSEEGQERGEQQPQQDQGDSQDDKGDQQDGQDGDQSGSGEDEQQDQGDSQDGKGQGKGDQQDQQDGDQNGQGKGEPQENGEQGDQEDGNGQPQGGQSGDDRIEDAMKETNQSDSMKDADERNEMTEEEMEKINKEMESMSKEEEDNKREELKKKREERQKNNDVNAPSKVYKPISWKKLIKMMIPKTKEVEEESLTKMHRRTRSSMASASKDTPVAVKAGTIKDEETSQSMLFILDNSGSMSSVINSVNKDILQIIDKNKSLGIHNFFIIKFDSDYDVYKINLDMKGKKHTYQQFMNNKDIITKADEAKLAPTEHRIQELFQDSWGGGTVFPEEISRIVIKLLDKNYNSVMFTDSDILGGNNITSLKKICTKAKKRPYSFNLILNSASTYSRVKEKIGSYKFMSHLDF